MASEATSETAKNGPYPEVPQRPNFPEIEGRVLQFWKDREIFQKSLKLRDAGESGANDFVFYDGPPFANGLPHYGHLVTGYVKDVVPRYQTMRGRHVGRRFGWDCHGLPAELESERQLEISGRKNILEYGIDKFNQHCRSTALRYTREWEKIVERQARWVDFENDYKTMDLDFMESVIWAFKQLWDKGYVYEGFRVLPYSWKAETPVSNFETRIDDSYRERQDPAITVTFELTPEAGDNGAIRLMVWTTTPWTLPSNLALAVSKSLDYAVYEEDGVQYILADALVPSYEKQLEGARKTGTVSGADLVGRTYAPMFPYFRETANAFRVIDADFVDDTEGTGIVHLAPGFGEDDQRVCEAEEIPIVCPVDERGQFTREVPDYQGRLVFDANKDIIRSLKDRGTLVKHESYVHNYPHCWRTDEPLIYKAINSWFVRVPDFRDRMAELNQEISWIPEHIRDGQFGNWLKNAQPWSISRDRYWGTPIPVWRSDNPDYPRIDVYGSLDEIERDFGRRPTDLHRPEIDEFVRPNPDDPSGESMMRRVEQVFDCWFESGSMPFAQVHYPFENQDWFEKNFPADFIAEYVAQTRGWFYTLVVLSTALFDRPPFRNAICHGVILDETGEKLSKRLRNYPDPAEVFDTLGSDALRWFLNSSPILSGQNLAIDRKGKEIAKAARQAISPLWNAFYFFTLYANADEIRAQVDAGSRSLLDRYILGKTRSLVEDVTDLMDAYNIPGACNRITAFMDALNNWYIRRSRDRFWSPEKKRDKQEAYNTLYTVLTVVTRVAAPLMPLIAEEIYRSLTGEESVHLTDWVDPEELPDESELVKQIDHVRAVASVAISLRQDHSIRVRQPLSRLTIVGPDSSQLEPFFDQLQEEVNVKEITTSQSLEDFGAYLLKVDARKVGPRLGSEVQKVIKAAKAGEWSRGEDGLIEVGGHELQADEYELLLETDENSESRPLPDKSAIVVLDVEISPELEREGHARDLVRAIQDCRRNMGLHVSDRIRLLLNLPPSLADAVEAHRDYISDQTLADKIVVESDWKVEPEFREDREIAGEKVVVGIRTVEPS